MKQKIFSIYEAYQDKVNIELFNETISFVADISPSDKITEVVRNLRHTHLWYQQVDNILPNKYRVRYFGELLERYEERIGNDIKNIRALALALAYCTEMITDDLFVGNQKINFIRKIRSLSEEDLYLKGALYLLGVKDAQQIFQSIAEAEYHSTEELLFALSLFDDYALGFERLKPQLLKLLGSGRTMPAFQNAGAFQWFLEQSDKLIQQSRKKDMRLFKALLQVRESFVKTKSSAYQILLEHGYSCEEIRYLNFVLIDCLHGSYTVSADGIVGEKIAVEFCKYFLNSSNSHTENIYWLINQALKLYRKFEIKCYGHKNMKDALSECVAVQNPKTFLHVYETLGTGIISGFDMLDGKWDQLAADMEAETYTKLFDEHLVQIEDNSLVQQWIDRFQMLTSTRYLFTFKNNFDYIRLPAFQYLVQHSLIRLEGIFEEGVKEYSEKDYSPKGFLRYVSEFVKNINCREAFQFWQYFFSKYRNEEIKKLFDFSDFNNSFWEKRYNDYYSCHADYRLKINRDFLSEEEKLQLFSWGEQFFFECSPEEYSKYILAALKDECIRAICPHEDLRDIYFFLRKADPDLADSKSLKEYYLTSEELQEEENYRIQAEQEQKRREEQARRDKLSDELNETYKHSWETLHQFFDDHKYSWKDEDVAFEIALPKFNELFDEQQPTEKDDFLCFVKICKLLLDKGRLSILETLEYMKKINLPKEELTNETSVIAS